MIEGISPAGSEGSFRSLTAMTAAGRPDPSPIAELGERYGMPFPEPEWLADVVARYGLTPLHR
jgi:hypothetical protein